MNILQLDVMTDGRSVPRQFEVKRMVNAGYVGRNREAVKAHIDELSREGVPPPLSVPMIFPVLGHNVTTLNEIEVIGNNTSGEVEFVLLLDGENVLVGVGSDHTDRALETHNISMSKQVCRNVVSRDVWELKDVDSGWDELILQSWVKVDEADKEILYQKAPLGTIISPAELMDMIKSHINDGKDDGLVIFSGTIPVVAGEIIYGSYFRGELIDSRLNRTLSCEYKIKKLDYLQEMEPV